MKFALATVVALSVSAGAVVTWDSQDPAAGALAGIKANPQTIATPASSFVAGTPGQPLKIVGVKIGNGSLIVKSVFAPRVDAWSIVSLGNGQVGVRVEACGVNPPGQNGYEVGDSNAHTYAFAGLRYDAAAKKVYLGDAFVASDRGFFRGLELENGYELESKTSEDAADMSADGGYWEVTEVALVNKAGR